MAVSPWMNKKLLQQNASNRVFVIPLSRKFAHFCVNFLLVRYHNAAEQKHVANGYHHLHPKLMQSPTLTGRTAAAKQKKNEKQIENIIYNILPCLIWVVGFYFGAKSSLLVHKIKTNAQREGSRGKNGAQKTPLIQKQSDKNNRQQCE